MNHDFETTVKISPHADGIHCGECRFCNTRRSSCSAFPAIPDDRYRNVDTPLTVDESDNDVFEIRCTACLDTEKAAQAARKEA